MIIIQPYNRDWPAQFISARQRLREILGHLAVGIEHIGSTAVPGLGAKDVIDIQVSVKSLTPGILDALNASGWRARLGDPDIFDGMASESPELTKYYAREPKGDSQRIHVHIREVGRFNHRFALLFRDFLRADENARAQYQTFKRQAALAYPNDINGYLALKAPVFNLLYRMAETWAAMTHWDESRYTGFVSDSVSRDEPPS